MFDKEETSSKATGVNRVPSLEKYYFSYRAGMQKQWIESNSLFLDYVGRNYGQSMRASLQAGKLIVIEVDKSILLKFKFY